MIAAARRAYNRFAGRGDAAVTVPAMDGALRPNTALEDAELVLSLPAPDSLVAHRGGVLASTSAELRPLPGQASDGEVIGFDAEITCAASGPGDALAVGLGDGRIVLLDGVGERRILEVFANEKLACLTALAFAGGDLLVCQGSARHDTRGWKHDLMERGSSGSVWRLPLAGGPPVCLAKGLAWPFGLLPDAGGENCVVSESWRHRLLRLDARAPRLPQAVLEDLPGYPARLCAARRGGAWLAVFAPRSQLIEFVLREPGYRARMMREVPPEYWLAPALYSNRSFLEPLQGGGVKQMGILKPWAPCRSYGLVIRLDEDFEPQASLHSRADGRRHGVASVLETGDGSLLIASRGGDAVLSMSAEATGGEL